MIISTADGGGRKKGKTYMGSDKLDDVRPLRMADEYDKDKDNRREDNREMSDKLPDCPYDQ